MAQAKIMVRPSILMQSEAFKDGYDVAQRNTEYVGWPIKYTPREDSIVQVLRDALAIVGSDQAHDGDTEYDLRWIAGLIAGWLTREEPYTRGS